MTIKTHPLTDLIYSGTEYYNSAEAFNLRERLKEEKYKTLKGFCNSHKCFKTGLHGRNASIRGTLKTMNNKFIETCPDCGNSLSPRWLNPILDKLIKKPTIKSHECPRCGGLYYSGRPAGLCPVCQDSSGILFQLDNGRVRLMRCRNMELEEVSEPCKRNSTPLEGSGCFLITKTPGICPYCGDNLLSELCDWDLVLFYWKEITSRYCMHEI